MKRRSKGSILEEREMTNLEADEVSSSSQWRMCLTLRLKTVADCLTSLLSSITTALTPATVSMKFVNTHCFDLRIRFSDSNVSGWMLGDSKRVYVFTWRSNQGKWFVRSSWFTHCSGIWAIVFAIIWALVKAQMATELNKVNVVA